MVENPWCRRRPTPYRPMKRITSELAYLLGERRLRAQIRALGKYLLFVLVVIAFYSAAFRYLMLVMEGVEHSWASSIYWTVVTMTTLGYGDITFTHDLGRLFSALVLLSGIVLLLIVLPFTFIRYFYAPWLEARVRLQAPRGLPAETTDHVLIARYDSLTADLIEKLAFHEIPYVVIENDPDAATRLHGEGVSVVQGDVESRQALEQARVRNARLVLANTPEDTVNTNIALTVREVSAEVPIAAVAEEDDSVDILELAGCNHVLALKRRLGEHLAARVNPGHAEAHVIGEFRDLQIVEFPVHNTPLVGKSLRQTRLREAIGVNVVGVWERGKFLPVAPDTVLNDFSVPVAVGRADQVEELNSLLVIYDTNYNPVVVIGGGKVGCAATEELRRKEMKVNLVEKNPSLEESLREVPDRLVLGDAADRRVLEEAGLAAAPAVLLTTNSDAMNIYLAVYCRRLNPELRIVTRITHDRNIEAIHRAGADFVLSYDTLGVETVLDLLRGEGAFVLGEGATLVTVPVPPKLVGRTLAQGEVGARTGVNVIAVEAAGRLQTGPPASTALEEGAEMMLLGTVDQVEAFRKEYS